MAKPLYIDDLISPKTGIALNMKVIENNMKERYFSSIAEKIKIGSIYDKDNITVWAKVPTEHPDDYDKPLHYDVLLEFYPTKNVDKDSLFIKSYGVRVYSNCPTFIYGFTYIYNDLKALVSYIPNKYYPKKALKDKPKQKNPLELSGIEKSIWYTIFHMKNNGLFRKIKLKALKYSMSQKDLLENIKSQEDKLAQISSLRKTKIIKKKGDKVSRKKESNKKHVKVKKSGLTNRLSNSLKKSMKSETANKLKGSLNAIKPNALLNNNLKK